MSKPSNAGDLRTALSALGRGAKPGQNLKQPTNIGLTIKALQARINSGTESESSLARLKIRLNKLRRQAGANV